MALVSLRPGQVSRLAQQGHRGAQAAGWSRTPTGSCPPCRSASRSPASSRRAFGAVTLAEPVAAGLRPARRARRRWPPRVALVAVTVIVAYVSLVLGELAPKRIALQRAEGVARLAAAPWTGSPGWPGR